MIKNKISSKNTLIGGAIILICLTYFLWDHYRDPGLLKIKITSWANLNEPIPKVKADNEIFGENPNCIICDGLREDIKKYGDMARRFIPDNNIEIESFDVTGDSINESILFLSSRGGNHFPHEIKVIKDEQIVFKVSEGLVGLDIEPVSDGNGFVIRWVPLNKPGWDYGLSSPPGYIETRFVYQNGKFMPAFEQEVRYCRS